MMIVTGGAGFIGSCIVRTLNDMGIEDIIIVDHIGKTDKWLNLRNKKYLEYIGRDRLPERLPAYAGRVTHVIHMGACSATTEKDFDFLCDNNVAYSKMLWDFCAKHQISFLYASMWDLSFLMCMGRTNISKAKWQAWFSIHFAGSDKKGRCGFLNLTERAVGTECRVGILFM